MRRLTPSSGRLTKADKKKAKQKRNFYNKNDKRLFEE